MKESNRPKDIEMNNKNHEGKIYYQEDIDRIFDKITETTEVFIITNENPKYESIIKQSNVIRINLQNYILKGSINLELLPNFMPHLEGIIIKNVPLKTLKGLPSELHMLRSITVAHCPLDSLKYIPNSLPNLKNFIITSCNLTNLNHFPEIVPDLKKILLHHNQITSLKGLPLDLPNLKDFNVNHNNLTSLKYLPKMNTKSIWIEGNPLRTLFNLSEEQIKKFKNSSYLWKSFTLSPRGTQLINEYQISYVNEYGINTIRTYPKVLKNKIMKFYSKPISEIAEKYIKHPKTITEDELDRLIWEADLEDRKFLEANLPNLSTDLVLRKINQRLSIKLPSNLTLLK